MAVINPKTEQIALRTVVDSTSGTLVITLKNGKPVKAVFTYYVSNRMVLHLSIHNVWRALVERYKTRIWSLM